LRVSVSTVASSSQFLHHPCATSLAGVFEQGSHGESHGVPDRDCDPGARDRSRGQQYSYNLGLARGLTDNGRTITFAPGPWGFGFGFFPLFPFLFIFFWFWFFVLRALFWRGPWGRPAWRYDGVPPAFDEWHRRAHARQDPPSPAPKADAHA